MGERGSPSGLSDLEIEVAKAIAAEWDAVAQKHPFSPEIYFLLHGKLAFAFPRLPAVEIAACLLCAEAAGLRGNARARSPVY